MEKHLKQVALVLGGAVSKWKDATSNVLGGAIRNAGARGRLQKATGRGSGRC